MKEDVVYVFKTSPKTLGRVIEKVLDTPDFQKLNPEKETLIKINANYDRFWPGCNTSGWFLDALLKNLRKKGFRDLKAIEGDLKLQPAVKTIKAIGIDKILSRYEVPFVPIENLPRDGELPRIIKGNQLISTPVLHTHTFATVSIATKNLYGLLPVYREKYHHVLSRKLLELAKNVKVFTIVDGTVGLDGGSMRMGNPVKTDLVLAGWNPIAIDNIASQIMGIPLQEIPYLRMAMKEGLTNSVSLNGDFSRDDLPHFSFSYENSALTGLLCNLDSWLRRNGITGRLFEYNRPLDRLGNQARRKYTKYVYNKRKEVVSKGNWIEYQHEFNKNF